MGTTRRNGKKNPPSWCRNVQHWEGLCDIWAKEGWARISSSNRENMTKGGPVVHHVGGSRSTYQHMQKLVQITFMCIKTNITVDPKVLNHIYKFKSKIGELQKSKLAKEGRDASLRDLFDATHMKDTPEGRVYVIEKAKKTVVQLPFPYYYIAVIK